MSRKWRYHSKKGGFVSTIVRNNKYLSSHSRNEKKTLLWILDGGKPGKALKVERCSVFNGGILCPYETYWLYWSAFTSTGAKSNVVPDCLTESVESTSFNFQSYNKSGVQTLTYLMYAIALYYNTFLSFTDCTATAALLSEFVFLWTRLDLISSPLGSIIVGRAISIRTVLTTV